MVLHQLLKKTHNNHCLPQFPPLQYGDAITLTLLLWRIHEAMQCPAGQHLLAPATLARKPYTGWTQVGAASGSYLNGGSPFAFLITPQPPARQPWRTCLVIDVIPLRNLFEVFRRNVFCAIQLLVLQSRGI